MHADTSSVDRSFWRASTTMQAHADPSLWRPPRLSASSVVARTEGPGDTAGEAALGSAELFGERDDDAIGAAEVAEPIEILVLRHLADELGAVSPHAGNDVVDVVDGEHDAT